MTVVFIAHPCITLGMNFLGHACLSFHEKEILVGNIISDFVKGRTQYDYPAAIHKGILLHRAIDSFTDAHTAARAISQYFKPAYRLYAPAITDVLIDYFLANDKNEFINEQALFTFTQSTYLSLETFQKFFPVKFAYMFPYMQSQNWLYNYRQKEGIRKSLQGVLHRAKYIDEMDTAFEIFQDNIFVFQELYENFYPSVKTFAARKMEDLLNS